MQDSVKKANWIMVEGKPVKFRSNCETGRHFGVSDSSISKHRQRCVERGETKFMYKSTMIYTYDPTEEFIPKRSKYIGLFPKTLERDKEKIRSNSLIPGLVCYKSGRYLY